jgi:hypothetical protein
MCRVFVELTPDEVAKLHTLGGPSWVRLQLRDAAAPSNSVRRLYELTPAERRQMLADLPALGRSATAQKYRVKPTVIDGLRIRAESVTP